MARARKFPNPPAGLTAAAAARWRELGPQLAAGADLVTFATYCQVWARWQAAEEAISKSGALIRNAAGRAVGNPYLQVSQSASREVRALEQRLRLLPAGVADAAPGLDLLTRSELASALGVVQFTITRWEQDGMPVAKKAPRGKNSLFSLSAVRAWREAVDQAKTPGLSLSDERARVAKLQQEKLGLDLALRRGELLERRAVLFEGQQFTKAIGAKIRGLPRAMVNAGLVARDREAEVGAVLRDLLTDISNWKFVEDLAAAVAGLKDAS